jgi:hypothetical protein
VAEFFHILRKRVQGKSGQSAPKWQGGWTPPISPEYDDQAREGYERRKAERRSYIDGRHVRVKRASAILARRVPKTAAPDRLDRYGVERCRDCLVTA